MAIYYSAHRARPLNDTERVTVDGVVSGRQTDEFVADGGESFCVYGGDESGEDNGNQVFAGATRLPTRTAEACWTAVVYWTELISELRLVLPDSEWAVSIDDHDLVWDAEAQRYDPAS